MRVNIGSQNYNLVGVWVPFDNGSKERLVNFKSFLSCMESILDVYDNERVILLGDWNCDLNRGKRFDKLLSRFIVENKLNDCFNLFDPKIDHTYKKKNYKSNIDHIIVRSSEEKLITDFDVYDDVINFSDHNGIY